MLETAQLSMSPHSYVRAATSQVIASLLRRIPELAPLLAPHYLAAVANQPASTLLEGPGGDLMAPAGRTFSQLKVCCCSSCCCWV